MKLGQYESSSDQQDCKHFCWNHEYEHINTQVHVFAGSHPAEYPKVEGLFTLRRDADHASYRVYIYIFQIPYVKGPGEVHPHSAYMRKNG